MIEIFAFLILGAIAFVAGVIFVGSAMWLYSTLRDWKDGTEDLFDVIFVFAAAIFMGTMFLSMLLLIVLLSMGVEI